MKPLIDKNQIAELQDLLGEDFEDLVDTYLNDLNVQLKALYQAFDASDLETIYAKAHRLKSGSGSIGARRLSELFQQMENHSHEGDLTSCRTLMPQVDSSVQQTRQTFQQIVQANH